MQEHGTNDADLGKMIADYMENGFLENIIDMFRHDSSLYHLVGALIQDERVRVRIGVTAMVEELSRVDAGHASGAVPGLLRTLEHAEPFIRGDAANLLGIIGDSTALPFLRKAADGDGDPNVRLLAEEAITDIGAKKNIDRNQEVLMPRNYWLMKSEPAVFSFDDLKARPEKTDHWEGVRNYQARNYMRQMKKGDLALFYHSNCETPGIVGITEIVRTAYPDHTSWDASSRYYDPKSTPEAPRWFMVDVRWKKQFRDIVSLSQLREIPALQGMKVLQKGQRLSVMPVTEAEFETVVKLAGATYSQGT